jgi:hypothetical protein
MAFIFACIVVGTIIVSGGLLGYVCVRDAVRSHHADRQEAVQREADEHAFSLISKGQGGAI